MGVYRERYDKAIADILHWEEEKRRLLEATRRFYRQQGRDRVSVEYLADQDQEVKTCQIMIDRARADAAAFGPAAVLESRET
jgi:glutathionylspermidine synthase